LSVPVSVEQRWHAVRELRLAPFDIPRRPARDHIDPAAEPWLQLAPFRLFNPEGTRGPANSLPGGFWCTGDAIETCRVKPWWTRLRDCGGRRRLEIITA
jgi:hypothetical protein